MSQLPMKRLIVPGGGGRTFHLGDGISAVCKASAGDTGGAFSLFELTMAPGAAVPPHVHWSEDEAYFVLGGRFATLLGDQTVEATPGTCLYGPRNVPHGLTSVGEEPGRLLVLTTPGGFERFFADLERIGGIPAVADAAAVEKLMILFDCYGMEPVAPGSAPCGSAAPPAPGRPIDLGDHRSRCLISADATGDAFSLLDVEVDPDGGPPPHLHAREDETFYILSGRFAGMIGDQAFEAGPGDCVFAPRDIPHVWRNVGDGPGRLLVLVTPGGFDRLVLELERIGPPSTPAAIQEMMVLSERYGIELAAPVK